MTNPKACPFRVCRPARGTATETASRHNQDPPRAHERGQRTTAGRGQHGSVTNLQQRPPATVRNTRSVNDPAADQGNTLSLALLERLRREYGAVVDADDDDMSWEPPLAVQAWDLAPKRRNAAAVAITSSIDQITIQVRTGRGPDGIWYFTVDEHDTSALLLHLLDIAKSVAAGRCEQRIAFGKSVVQVTLSDGRAIRSTRPGLGSLLPTGAGRSRARQTRSTPWT